MPKIYFEEKYPTLRDVITPPSPVSKANMKWWNSIEQRYSPELGIGNEPSAWVRNNRVGGSARTCPAISDAITHGYVLYSGTDVYFDTTVDPVRAQRTLGVPTDQDGNEILYRNDLWQTKDVLFTPTGFNPQTFKLDPMFGIRTEKGYSVLITSIFYRDDLPWRFMDSIIDTDTFPLYDHVSFWIKNDFSGVVKQGTPMFQVIPFKREGFDMEITPLDEFSRVSHSHAVYSTFTQGYKKHFWNRKKFK